ncbi:MAG: ribosome recycling factor [Kiritimatiellia bacterium]|jgi:ribosome recycling factor
MEEYLESMAEDMTGVIAALQRNLASVRTGRATPKLVDSVPVLVQSYGATMPLNQLATVQAPDARLLVVTPWDKTTLNDIQRGIVQAGLGLNPSTDGQLIRIPVPALTADRRRELVRQCRKFAEDAKVRVRHVRREYNEMFKAAEDDGDISEDEMHRMLAKVQDSTNARVKQVEQVVATKEAEVQEV